jgi:hypothetical protein
MKRSTVINKLLETLSKWESCKLEEPCANELLTSLEDLGLIQPSYLGDKDQYGTVRMNGWEPEGVTSEE